MWVHIVGDSQSVQLRNATTITARYKLKLFNYEYEDDDLVSEESLASDRQTDRQTDRQADGQVDRQKDKQNDRHRHTHA